MTDKSIVKTTENNDTNNSPQSIELTNNDMLRILNIIEVIQSRGQIKAINMFNIGSKYLRLSSYLKFLELDEEEKKNILDKEKEEKKEEYLKKLEITDLVFYFNFIDKHLKKENFKKDELFLVKNIYEKIYNTLKPYIKNESPEGDISPKKISNN